MARICVALISLAHAEDSGSSEQYLVSRRRGVAKLSPRLGDGSEADWWFAYKLNTFAYPECTSYRSCIFGGKIQDYSSGYSQQYLVASNVDGQTSEMTLQTDCLGMGLDPVAKTFEQIYEGSASNYVLWNDQMYGDPMNSKSAPWGHSKGALAWNADGVGFVMQVSTPDWPGNGDADKSRTEGNTLGCISDDDIEVGQHFFSLRLGSKSDTEAVLYALQKASVVTDPSLSQLVKLTDGPSDLANIARGLNHLNHSTTPFQATLSSGVKLIAKSSYMQVPPWQFVSALVGKPLRTATWWTNPAIPSAYAGKPGCWSDEISGTPSEVQIAVTGQWQGKAFNLKGGPSQNSNHAKLGISIGGSLNVMGDQNQQGCYQGGDPESGGCKCGSSQNGRGGIFFAFEDATLHAGLTDLFTGDTADYYTPGPSPPPPPTPPPTPSGDCGGAGVSYSPCRTSDSKALGCVYIYSDEAYECGTSNYGCYPRADLPETCPCTNCPEAGLEGLVQWQV